jgi:phage gpG-like protein
MITAELVKGQDAVQRLQAAGPRIASALEKSVLSMAIKLTGKVKSQKLSGQVLHVRSNALRSSVHYETHFAPTKKMAEVGTNVKYARIHEYGGKIKHYARSQRAYFRMSKNGEVGSRFVKKSRSNFAQWVTIGEHSVVMPERSFLRSAARELIPEIDSALKEALNAELRKLHKP